MSNRIPAATPGLFSPLMLGNTRLSNRIVMSALSSGLTAPDGFVTNELAAYYQERAQGGAGLIVIEPAAVLPPSDNNLPHLGLYADAQVSDLHHCIQAVRQTGAAVLVMLDQHLQLASFTEPELISIGEACIAAAWRARAAGAHGVMFSSAHAGIFEQLVSPLYNHRTDRYGGSIDKRLRLLLDVVEGIEKWIGGSFIVGTRLNVEEFTPGGLTLQDARVIAKRLSSAGVKLIEVCIEIHIDTPVAQFPGWLVPHASGIKAIIDIPIMVGGSLDDPELADSLIRDRSVDLIAVGERLAVEPNWPRQAQAILGQ